MNLSLWLNNREFKLNLKEKGKNDIQVSIGKRKHHVSAEFLNADEVLLNINGKIFNVIISSNATSYSVCVNRSCYRIEKKSAAQILGEKDKKQEKRDIKTSMPGKIIKILVQEGEEVKEGQAVLILEAMKMQNEIKSPQAGKITKINPDAGDSVETGTLLFTVE